ncbi:MAG: cbb3-type cytochrome c oxidase subunit I [Deltaproteobacteria bacterium]|nr:cbb3-type cytochrome c oxidase subunit I [Myxococcales bacterium]MDP3216390.1 cbb3-type cytochrome c oxidase subunit I [Deltaproteobacteria bacterium]
MHPDDRRTALRTLSLAGLGAALGGLLSLLLRWQLSFPGRPIPLLGPLLFPDHRGAVPAASYPALFTLHGTVMIFFAVTPALSALALIRLPPLVGRERPAHPALHRAALGLFALGLALLLAGLHARFGAPAFGWTAAPPLSTARSPGAGATLWLLAVACSALATLLGSFDVLATIVGAPKLAWSRLPLSAWGHLFAATLNALFLPILLGALALLFSDRHLGTALFTAPSQPGGDALVYQHLFWIFGHPEVYILILPVWGAVSDALARAADRPPALRRAVVAAMAAVTLLSGLVYGHHLLTAGLSPLLAQGFMTLTLLISLPSAAFVASWIATLHGASLGPDAPASYSLAAVVLFVLGGLTGIPLALVTTDRFLHDSAFVVGHFHLVMAATILLGLFAMLHEALGRLGLRAPSIPVARLHAWATALGALGVFIPMLRLGLGGAPRRLYDPDLYRYLHPLLAWQRVATVAAALLFTAQLAWLVAWWRGRR